MSTVEPQPEMADSRATMSSADVAVADTQHTVRAQDGGRAERLFSKSIVISGIRCVLAYLILPFVTPFIGLAPGVGAGFGLIIGVVAIAANLFSIRRFWLADHRWKMPVTVLHVCVIALLLVLAVLDVMELVG